MYLNPVVMVESWCIFVKSASLSLWRTSSSRLMPPPVRTQAPRAKMDSVAGIRAHTDASPGIWKYDERPKFIIREVRWQIDNCGAINKSRFCLGSITFLMLLGFLSFMVVGYTKFDLYDLAREIAGYVFLGLPKSF